MTVRSAKEASDLDIAFPAFFFGCEKKPAHGPVSLIGEVMYLKSIEMQGFKSFADRIVFSFQEGITGIVGPNGSGKSNVADAVRWVLGEQKVKQLRSSTMQDVIFSGTENRKPLGFAYVALTLDNTDHFLTLDYAEVTVSRRVYRSGESEYRINGTQVRLRDVQELFYDTGVGKEGYSIIGQGQIDRILSGKPEERRELFDEAAGIVKYKRRKSVTLKKLENEQQNLEQSLVVLKELEHRVGPLERQSLKAREYLKKKEELKQYDTALFLAQNARFEKESGVLSSSIAIAEEQHAADSEQALKVLAQYEETHAEIREKDTQIAEFSRLLSGDAAEKEKLEGRIHVLEEQVHAIEQDDAHVKERLDALAADLDRRERDGKQYRLRLAEDEKEREKTGQEREALQAEALRLQEQTDRDAGALEEGRNALLALLTERAQMESEKEHFRTMQEQAALREKELRAELDSQQKKRDALQEELKSAAQSLQEVGDTILAKEKQRALLSGRARRWREQEQELEKTLAAMREEYHRKRSRLESLKNIAERYDGYGNSIRRVMERRRDTPGILGVVADLIHTGECYETAIETALGGSIRNIVTDNEETAKRMIRYLKEGRYGRATFLPLSAMKAPDRVPGVQVLGEPGVLGLADTLVETKEEYRPVAASLLGRILVVDTLDHAAALAKKYHYTLRIVTLEGDLLAPGGSMTGGAYKNKSGLLGRNREIEELEKEIGNAREKEAGIRQRLEEIQTARQLQEEDSAELEDALRGDELKRNTLQVNLEHLLEEDAVLQDSCDGLMEQIAGYQAQRNEMDSGSEESARRMEDSRRKEEAQIQENERLAAQEAQNRAHLEDVQQQIASLNMKLARLEEACAFEEENIRRTADEILSFHEQQQTILLGAANSGREIEERQKEMEQLRRQAAAAGTAREEHQNRLLSCTQEKESQTALQANLLKKRERLSEELTRMEQELFRLNDRKQKLEETHEKSVNYMWEEYELTLHEAAGLHGMADCSEAECKKRILSLKEEIRALGQVNVSAIEEYKEVSGRYEFLRAQHEDLVQGAEALKRIIADLDRGMKKQFSEKFAAIQEEFNRAFRELFGGGKGTLQLALDEDKDILDCGVRIIAQPPGKKLQNMMQLSGGEKALTAIALLFAIQNLKPSPFCLLDEIEAALDDPNVVRFANYLRKLTVNTQFIVITHRRGTMTAADRLYGITMQEKGVSTMVSVDLIENELEETPAGSE